jgi:hypothetical protein
VPTLTDDMLAVLSERVTISTGHMQSAADVMLYHANRLDQMGMKNMAAHLRHNAMLLKQVAENNDAAQLMCGASKH